MMYWVAAKAAELSNLASVWLFVISLALQCAFVASKSKAAVRMAFVPAVVSCGATLTESAARLLCRPGAVGGGGSLAAGFHVGCPGKRVFDHVKRVTVWTNKSRRPVAVRSASNNNYARTRYQRSVTQNITSSRDNCCGHM